MAARRSAAMGPSPRGTCIITMASHNFYALCAAPRVIPRRQEHAEAVQGSAAQGDHYHAHSLMMGTVRQRKRPSGGGQVSERSRSKDAIEGVVRRVGGRLGDAVAGLAGASANAVLGPVQLLAALVVQLRGETHRVAIVQQRSQTSVPQPRTTASTARQVQRLLSRQAAAQRDSAF